jgi:anaerobic magnesium-protoporphyrin IX monomethyl ester cyclase
VVLYDDVFNWFTKMCLGRMREAAVAMARDARAAGAWVVVSGHDAADAPQVYLDAGADYVVVGEGELTLAELFGRLPVRPEPAAATAAGTAARAGTGARAEARVDDVPGLVFRQRGMLRRTGPRALLKDLDSLPPAAWDLVDIERYRAFWRRRHGYFSLNLVTTRGCPYLCNWCAKPVYGNTYHMRSPDSVVDEMRLLSQRYAPDHLWFCDDIFGLKPRWLGPFSERVAAEGLAIPFLCQTRADLTHNESYVRALRRAGCAEAWLGVESGAQAVLDAMDKGITLEDIRGAARNLRAAGIRIGFFLQFGYPEEGWPEVEMTRGLLRELDPDDIGISVSYPLPGTRFHERVEAQLGEKRNWSESDDLDPLFPGRFPRSFYRLLSRTVHAEFRARRAAAALRTLLADPFAADGATLRATIGLAKLPVWLAGRAQLEWKRTRAERPQSPATPPR